MLDEASALGDEGCPGCFGVFAGVLGESVVLLPDDVFDEALGLAEGRFAMLATRSCRTCMIGNIGLYHRKLECDIPRYPSI
jgi:hypothetical protein